MSKKNITINELTNIECNFKNGVKPRECALKMRIGKDKVYFYYSLFESGLTVIQVYESYLVNKSRCGRKKIVIAEEKLAYIKEKLTVDGWSLDEIAGRDKLLKTNNLPSTTTLYRRADEGIIPISWLLRKGKKKYQKGNTKKEGLVKDVLTIHQRNEKYSENELKTEFGHLEGDTIVGKDHASAVITIDDRATKFRVLLKSDRKSEDTCNTIAKWSEIFKELIKSLTLDRGSEFSKWKTIEITGLEVYFSDTGTPSQRGLNEHNNGITRRDLPKGIDLSVYSQEDLNKIADKINNKPRKILGYKTANEMLKKLTGFDTILM